MNPLPVLPPRVEDCWNRIGVRGDGSCERLAVVVHCHNCTVFASAGRQFLDAPSPEGYLHEWTQRLAQPIEEAASSRQGVLIFRLGEEWLALPVALLVEVTMPRVVHRVPHRGGILAGLVNIRGELHLSVHLEQVLGLPRDAAVAGRPRARLLVTRREAARWVFAVDEVDQVHRLAADDLGRAPATIARALAHLTRGVFHWQQRTVGLLDEDRLFSTLRTRLR